MTQETSPYLTKAEISAWKPYPRPDDADHLTPTERARQRMEAAGQWAPWQILGRGMVVGCVALEITQRCNLDCTYCYLSESSEALKDIPIEEVYRRIDLIHAHYGPLTNVQVTGGDPTLRNYDELIAIVRYIKAKGMRSALLTNGIKASRKMLEDLCEAGLEDVAFHVDMTQDRKGYASEAALNAVREEYINRARGLPLAVIFNNTVSPTNFHDIPALIQFYVKHADVVRFASFQVGADMGRGADRTRVTVSPDTVMQAIRDGAGAHLTFDALSAGHAKCNGYAFGLVINNKVHDFLYDHGFVSGVLASAAHLQIDRADKKSIRNTVISYFVRHPKMFLGTLSQLARILWRARRDVIAARGKVSKISFFVHNFMDSAQLEKDRCEACSFMVITPEGPMSMCVHNAKRDNYLLVASPVERNGKMKYFNPATGLLEDRMPDKITVALNRKNARGRAKDMPESLTAREHAEAAE